jgi:Na+-driven multidrug efflux pump
MYGDRGRDGDRCESLTTRGFGERKVESANRAAGQSLFLSLAIGLVVILATNLFPARYFNLYGATEDILVLGEQYMSMLGWGCLCYFFT